MRSRLGWEQDVLDVALAKAKTLDTAEYAPERAANSLHAGGQVRREKKGLKVGNESIEILPELLAELTLTAASEAIIATLAEGVRRGKRATLIYAPADVDASASVRWCLRALGRASETVRLNRSCFVNDLVGTSQPTAEGIRPVPGKLTQMVDQHGVFVADRVESAEAETLALLTALARGDKSYDYLGEPRTIADDFHLVLIVDSSQPVSNEIRALMRMVDNRALLERGHDRNEHARLLRERCDVSENLAERAADLHDAIAKATLEGKLSLGENVPADWRLLERVGRRLGQLQRATREDLAEAFTSVYRARLSTPADLDAFDALLTAHKLEPTEPTVRIPEEDGFTVTPSVRRTYAQLATALDAAEPVLITGPHQSGVTRIVEKVFRDRGQELITVSAYPGMEPGFLEQVTLVQGNHLETLPAQVRDSMENGKALYIDKFDYLSPDRQQYFFDLAERHAAPGFRLVLSTTIGRDRLRRPPRGDARAQVTEIVHAGPDLTELPRFLPGQHPQRDKIIECAMPVLERLAAAYPQRQFNKLQMFRHVIRAAEILSDHMPLEAALRRATTLIYRLDAKEPALCDLAEPPALDPPFYLRATGLTREQATARAAAHYYSIEPETERLLDSGILAAMLGMPVIYVGDPGHGKTVAGYILGLVLDKDVERFNYNQDTTARDMFGGQEVVTRAGQQSVEHVDGRVERAVQEQQLILHDEPNLSDRASVILAPTFDYRRHLMRLRFNTELSAVEYETPMGDTVSVVAQNTASTQGRTETPEAILDLGLVQHVEPMPIAQRVRVLSAHSKIAPDVIKKVVRFHDEFALAIAKGKFDSAVTRYPPFSLRDVGKPLLLAQVLIAQDGVTDAALQAAVVAREVVRVARSPLTDTGERDSVLKLAKKCFRNGSMDNTDWVLAPERPTEINVVRRKVKGKAERFARVGCVELRVRGADEDMVDRARADRLALPWVPTLADINAAVPQPEDCFTPVGCQLEELEELMLCRKAGIPTARIADQGCGKTEISRFLARLLNMPLWSQQYHDKMRPGDLTGYSILQGDKVEYLYPPMARSLLAGGIWAPDEVLMGKGQVREITNAVTEGSMLTIDGPQPVRLHRDDWHPEASAVFSTNPLGIRRSDFSDAEKSRLLIGAARLLETEEEFLAVAENVIARQGLATIADEVRDLTKFYFWARAQFVEHKEASTMVSWQVRLLRAFIDMYSSMRGAGIGASHAALTSMEHTLLLRLPEALRDKVTTELSRRFCGQGAEADATLEILQQGVRFGQAVIPYGSARRYEPNAIRYAWTKWRQKVAGELAADIVFGGGRPTIMVDDANEDNVDMLREMARTSGHRLTLISLPPRGDLEGLVESYQLVNSEERASFDAIKGKIAAAVARGDWVAFRRVNEVNPETLGRWNELLDSQRRLTLSITKERLAFPSEGRIFVLRDIGGKPLANDFLSRFLQPPLATNEALSPHTLGERLGQLQAVIQLRAQVSAFAAVKIAQIHTLLNMLLTPGLTKAQPFIDGQRLGFISAKDALELAALLEWLQQNDLVSDEREAIFTLAMNVYGDRFDHPADQKAFAAEVTRILEVGQGLTLDDAVTVTDSTVRCGPWTVTRDPRSLSRPGVPSATSGVPEVASLGELRQKLYGAWLGGKCVHVHGGAMAESVLRSCARELRSAVVDIGGNPKISESQLFGGWFQKQDGSFANLEGSLVKAQRDRSMVIIRNASQLSSDVMASLEKLASDKEITWFENGVEHCEQVAFKLVLLTDSNDPPLRPDLARACRKIRNPKIEDKNEALRVLRAILGGLPGADALARELSKLARGAQALEKKHRPDLHGIRFDNDYAFAAASALVHSCARGTAIEDALASVLRSAYLAPARGTKIFDKVEELVARCLADLPAGTWTGVEAEAYDWLQNPGVGRLLEDFRAILPDLTGSLLAALAEVPAEEIAPALSAIRAAHVLPADTVDTFVRSTTNPRSERRQAPALSGLNTDNFVQGARIADLDARAALLQRYLGAAQTLARHGSATAAELAAALERGLQRLTKAGYEDIAKVRTDVQAALRFEQYEGPSKAEVARVVVTLGDAWQRILEARILNESGGELRHGVTDMRAPLDRLQSLMRGYIGPGTELPTLLQGAGELLLGRVAMQRNVRTNKALAADTEALVRRMAEQQEVLANLQSARGTFQAHKRRRDEIEQTLSTDPFLTAGLTNPASMQVALPDDAAIRKRAREKAAATALASAAGAWTQAALMAGAAMESGPVPGPDDLLLGFDYARADAGLVLHYEDHALSELDRRIGATRKAIDDGRVQDADALEDKLFEKMKEDAYASAKTEIVSATRTMGRRSGLELADAAAAMARRLEASMAGAQDERAERTRDAVRLVKDSERDLRRWVTDFEQWTRREGGLLKAIGKFWGWAKETPPPTAPDLTQAQRAAKAALEEAASVALRGARGALTQAGMACSGDALQFDDTKVEACSEELHALKMDLETAPNLWDLGVRFARVRALAGQFGNIETHINEVLRRLGRDAKFGSILGTIDSLHLCIGDLLREVTNGGLSTTEDAAIEKVQEVVRVLNELSSDTHRFTSCTGRIRTAIAACDAVPEGRLFSAIHTVGAELTALLEAIDAYSGEGVLRYDANQMSTALADYLHEARDNAERIEHGEDGDHEGLRMSPARLRADIAMLAGSTTRESAAVLRTRLRVIDIDFELLARAQRAMLERRPVESGERVAGERITGTCKDLRTLLQPSFRDLRTGEKQAGLVLDAIERTIGADLLEQVGRQLGETATHMATLIEDEQAAAITAVDCAHAIQAAIETLAGFEDIPPRILAGLRTAWGRLADAEGAGAWASGNLSEVREAIDAAEALATRLRAKHAPAGEGTTLAQNLSAELATLAEQKDVLGALSRARLLAYIDRRLESLATFEDEAWRTALNEVRGQCRASLEWNLALSAGPEGDAVLQQIQDAVMHMVTLASSYKRFSALDLDTVARLVEHWQAFVASGEDGTLGDVCALAGNLSAGEASGKLRAKAAATEHLCRRLQTLRASTRLERLTEETLRQVNAAVTGYEQQRVLLSAAIDAYISYDPTGEQALDAVSEGLRQALRGVPPQGLGAAAMASDLDRLWSYLGQGSAASVLDFAREQQAIREYLAPFQHVSPPEQRCLHAVKQWADLARGDAGKSPTAPFVTLVQWLGAGVRRLLTAEPSAFAAELAELEEALSHGRLATRRIKPVKTSAAGMGASAQGHYNQAPAISVDGGVMLGRIEAGTGVVPHPEQQLEGINQRGALSGGPGVELPIDLTPVQIEVPDTDRAAQEIKDRVRSIEIDFARERVRAVDNSPVAELRRTQATGIAEIAAAMRQRPTEVVLMKDISSSTSNVYGSTRIIEQENAFCAIVMAAAQASEGNCGYTEFDNHLHLVDGMGLDEPITDEGIEAVLTNTQCPGGTNVYNAIYQACVTNSVFSADTTVDKWLCVVTDCQDNYYYAIQQLCAQLRRDYRIGIAFMGFGADHNVRDLGGALGAHVANFTEAAKQFADLLARTRVANDGTASGGLAAKASGIGVSLDQRALSVAAASASIDAGAAVVGKLFDEADGPQELYVARGERRVLTNLLDRRGYQDVLRELRTDQRRLAGSHSLAQCRRLVAEWNQLSQSSPWETQLREALQSALPQGGQVEWLYGQTEGGYIDPGKLPMLVKSLRDGRPILDFRMRPQESQAVDLHVVLSIDLSKSTSGPKRYKQIQGAFLFGDALKHLDPNIKITVTGCGRYPVLLAADDLDWEEAKAHVLHRANCNATCEHDATDDERGLVENLAVLEFSDCSHGWILNFSDGQGMPGTRSRMEDANRAGVCVVTVGLGPYATAVLGNFGEDFAVTATNLADLDGKAVARLIASQQRKHGMNGG
jgi:MoxR-like ATPase